MPESDIVITCAKGIVPFLKEETLSLGLPIVSEHLSAIETKGTLEDAMRLNLHVRTGQRVLFLIEDFDANDPDELYGNVSTIAWEQLFSEKSHFCVTSTVDNPTIRDSRYANLKCKDAIADRFSKEVGRRPDSGSDRTGVVIHLHWEGDRCRLFLDTSGEPLSRRGYRKNPLEAPMQETLAAATVLATGWDGEGHFINPMCGSGTLCIEAVMIGLHKPPGLLRNNFGFMHLKGFSEASWKELRGRAKRETKKSLGGRIIATDMSPKAIQAARQNAATAGAEHLIEFGVCDYSETSIPKEGGVIVLNPPYGERLGEMKALEQLYRGIGDFFKKRCVGYRGYIFTGNLSLAKKVGLRTKRRVPFYNGEIECRLLEYELYKGSKKGKSGG